MDGKLKNVSETISKSGLSFLLNPREFKNIKPWGSELLFEFVEDIRNSKSNKVLIIPDTDVDGVISAKEMQDTMMLVTRNQIAVYQHSYKTHGLSMPMLYNILKDGYTHVVIVDSSSNDLAELKWLSDHSIRVLVIDHHMTDYKLSDYPNKVTILNNKLCLKEGIRIPYKEVSCGALVALYCNYLYASYNLIFPQHFWAYAVLTLYSDGMDLFDEFNIMIIAYAREMSFLNDILCGISTRKGSVLSRDVLTFSISPKINSCLKANNFRPVLELFFNRTITSKRQIELCRELNSFNGYIKDRMNSVEQSLTPTIHGCVGTVNMTSFINDELADFKGTLANRAAEQLGKIVISYYIRKGICYASVRDPFNRDALSVFQDVTNAGGHKSAFGFSIKEEKLESVIRYVNLSFEEILSSRKSPLILSINEYEITGTDLDQMAIINEYAVNNGVFIKVFIDPNTYRIDNYYGRYTVKSPKFQMIGNSPVNYGDTVLAVPTMGIKTTVKIKTIIRS